MHKTLRKNISRQRLGIQLALALLGIGFFTWNEKRSQVRKENRLSSIQSYYSSFLESGKTPSKESFGIPTTERPDILPKILSEIEIDSNRQITDTLQNFFAESQMLTADPGYTDSDSDSDNEAVCDPLLVTARSVVKTMLVKARVSISLAARINAKPKYVAKNLNFVESSLLLLGNSMFKPCETASNRVDAILKGYGLERVQMPKDGNCLFSSVSFFIFHVLSAEIPVRDTILKEHLQTLGIYPDQELAEISHQLRKHVVNEFLGPNMTEYSSFLISSEQISYEETAKNFESNGFFDCELGNAAILALANIMRIGMVVFTSLENYPVITIVPRNEPIAHTTVYLAFEQIGAGHYDAVIESTIAAEDTGLAEDKPNDASDEQTAIPNTSGHSSVEKSCSSCRCGQGGAKNKQSRLFCENYKSGCKCFRSLTGCTKFCGCRNCANPYGVRAQEQNEMSSETQVRKRRKHVKSTETGRSFIIRQGEEVSDAPWSFIEELLCRECALYIGSTGEITEERVAELYNEIVLLLRNNSIQIPKDKTFNPYLEKIDKKDISAVKCFLTKIFREEEEFKEKMKQQINLNVDVVKSN